MFFPQEHGCPKNKKFKIFFSFLAFSWHPNKQKHIPSLILSQKLPTQIITKNMASGFIGGGAPNLFTSRSTNQAPQPSYRSNLSGLFLDPSTQIARHQQQLQQQPQQPHTITGKRTLFDYQAHQFQNQAGLNGFFYRSVKPHTYTSPISPL